MLSQDPLHQPPQIRPHVLAQRLVDPDIVPNGLNQLAGHFSQGLVAEHLHGAVVRLKPKRVVEGQFVLREPQPLAPGARLAHLAGKLNQLPNDLRGLGGPGSRSGEAMSAALKANRSVSSAL